MRPYFSKAAWTAVLLSMLMLTGCALSGPAATTTSTTDRLPPLQPPRLLNPSQAPAATQLADAAVVSELPYRLELPTIDVDTPVVELGWHVADNSTEDQIFSEWDVAEYAAGWHKNSALPGEAGNVVLSGHNNILGSVFRELDQLQAGDKAVLWAGDRRYTYEIDQIMIVPEKHVSAERRMENAKWIGPFDDDRLTLVSCWPRNNNTHRIIVVGHLDEQAPALTANTSQ